MTFYFKPTDKYYGGMRRVRVSEAPVFNSIAVAFVGLAIIYSILFFFVPVSNRQPVVVLFTSVFFGPIAIKAVGGVDRKGWIYYALMCSSWILFVILRSYDPTRRTAMFVSLLIPLFLYAFHKSSPHVLKSFCYLERTELVSEVFLSLFSTSIVLTVLYLVIVKAMKNDLIVKDISSYLEMTINCVIEYGIILGLMFGAFSKKILELRYPIGYLIGWNVVFWTIYQGPSAIGFDDALLILAGVVTTAFLQQLILGISFYLCRSTRIPLFLCLVLYIFYGSIEV